MVMELLEDPLCQIDQPPAHYAINRRDRAHLDHPRNGLALGIIEPRGLARRFAIQQTIRTVHVVMRSPSPE